MVEDIVEVLLSGKVLLEGKVVENIVEVLLLRKGSLPYRYTVELFLVDFSMWCRRDFRESDEIKKCAAFYERCSFQERCCLLRKVVEYIVELLPFTKGGRVYSRGAAFTKGAAF